MVDYQTKVTLGNMARLMDGYTTGTLGNEHWYHDGAWSDSRGIRARPGSSLEEIGRNRSIAPGWRRRFVLVCIFLLSLGSGLMGNGYGILCIAGYASRTQSFFFTANLNSETTT